LCADEHAAAKDARRGFHIPHSIALTQQLGHVDAFHDLDAALDQSAGSFRIAQVVGKVGEHTPRVPGQFHFSRTEWWVCEIPDDCEV
jgi:hypothetical protein